MLRLEDVHTHYGPVPVLRGVTLEVHEGELVCLLGSNAAGKTTTILTILGQVRPTRGEIWFKGRRTDSLRTSEVTGLGIAVVPEGRRVFGPLTVLENLQLGAFRRTDSAEIREDLDRVFALFPVLKSRAGQAAGTLSGGEQQMLAIGRALMVRPQLILMDEPSMGLAPMLVEQIFELVHEINQQGMTIFLVEQNAHMALRVAHRGYVMQHGEVVLEGDAKSLLDTDLVREAYL